MMWNDQFKTTNPLPKAFDIIHDSNMPGPPLRDSETQPGQVLAVLNTVNSITQEKLRLGASSESKGTCYPTLWAEHTLAS